jgi:hypothetical protein
MSHADCIGVCFYRHIHWAWCCHGTCIIHNVKKCGLNGACCDCNYFTLISLLWRILCAKFTYSLYSPQIINVHGFHHVVPSFTDTWCVPLVHHRSILYNVFSLPFIVTAWLIREPWNSIKTNSLLKHLSIEQVGSSSNAVITFIWDMPIMLIVLTGFSVFRCIHKIVKTDSKLYYISPFICPTT